MTLNVVEPPLVMEILAGEVVIVGLAVAAVMVTVAALLSTLPALLLTRTQYDVVAARAPVVYDALVVPESGVVVVPLAP
jgi:hypothetical protein